MEALIAAAASGSLAKALAAKSDVLGIAKLAVTPMIEVAALTPGTSADIRIAGVRRGITAAVNYALPSPWDERGARQPNRREVETWEAHVKQHRAETDLEQYRRISAKTILGAAEALITTREEK